jgi:hypothetical protein
MVFKNEVKQSKRLCILHAYTRKKIIILPNNFLGRNLNPTPPHILTMLISWVLDVVAVILLSIK